MGNNVVTAQAAPRVRAWVCAWIVAGAAQAQEGPGAPGVTADRVLFGQSAKLSGSSGTQTGRQYGAGLQLAFDAANGSGGAHGRRIELRALDDRNDAELAMRNTEALLDEHKVFALAGYTFSIPVRAVIPMLEAKGVPLVGAYTGMPELYADGRPSMVFSTRASFADEHAAIARHIATVGYAPVALVHYANPLGQEWRSEMARMLEGAGWRVAATAAMAMSTPDSTAAAEPAVRALAQDCPRLLVLGVSGRDAVAVIRGVRAGGCGDTRFIARGVVDTGLLQQELGDEARGVMVTQVVPNPMKGVHPLVEEYRKALRARGGGARPDFAEFEGYLVGRCIVLALERAGRALDRPRFIRALEGVRVAGPGAYRIEFHPGDRVGSRYVNIVMIADRERITD